MHAMQSCNRDAHHPRCCAGLTYLLGLASLPCVALSACLFDLLARRWLADADADADATTAPRGHVEHGMPSVTPPDQPCPCLLGAIIDFSCLLMDESQIASSP
ncbi:hypothetical protein CEP53_013759 [Fusarium sp. AF-6]|nr:hypothetical protein CEP53_013759 [Fusarium sp. AF-6]